MRTTTTQPLGCSPKFRDMPCRNGFTKTNKRRYIRQQSGTRSARGPADKPVVNRPLCSSIDLHMIFGCSCFRGDIQDNRFRWFGGYAGRLSSGRTDPWASRPAPPPCRAPRRPDPPVVCSGFGFDKLLQAIVFNFSVEKYTLVGIPIWRTTARFRSPISKLFPDMPRINRIYRDKKASFHWSAARNKARSSSR